MNRKTIKAEAKRLGVGYHRLRPEVERRMWNFREDFDTALKKAGETLTNKHGLDNSELRCHSPVRFAEWWQA